MYELIREDIVIKLGARFGEGGGEGEGEGEGEGDGEGVDGGDAAGHGGSGDLGGGGVELGLVNETVERAVKEAVLAERKDLGRL